MDILFGAPVLDMDTPYLKDKYVVLDVGVKDAMVFKQKHPNSISVFVSPPNQEELLKQCIGTYPSMLSNSKSQFQLAPQICDWLVINRDSDQAASDIERIMSLVKDNAHALGDLDEETLKFLYSHNFSNAANKRFVEEFYGKEREERQPGD